MIRATSSPRPSLSDDPRAHNGPCSYHRIKVSRPPAKATKKLPTPRYGRSVATLCVSDPGKNSVCPSETTNQQELRNDRNVRMSNAAPSLMSSRDTSSKPTAWPSNVSHASQSFSPTKQWLLPSGSSECESVNVPALLTTRVIISWSASSSEPRSKRLKTES